MRFYGYTKEQTLNEYARSFFGLINSMYRLKGEESLSLIQVHSALNGSEDALDNIKKESKGIHGILKEARIAKAFKK